VFAAFVAGLIIGSFVDGRPDTDLGVVVRVIAIASATYVIIHLVVMNVIVAGRIKRRDAANADGVESEEEYEDVVVYTNDTKSRTERRRTREQRGTRPR
jgi:hypothetical protein